MPAERDDSGRGRLEEYALALNDSIVQGLAAAKMALEMDELTRAQETIDHTLKRAQEIITDLLREVGADIRPGSLVRDERGGGDNGP
jgi:signal transduction histidine kinase